MSLLNCFVTPDGSSGLVAVDTEGVDAGGIPTLHVSKLVPIVHWPAVLAIRGCYGYLPISFLCLSTHPLADVRELIECAGSRLKDMHDIAKNWRAQGVIGADVQIDEFELAVLGWSAREQRTIGRVWGYWDGETNSQEVTADAPHTAPWDESLRGKQTLARHGERHCVAALMRDQIRLLEKKALNAAGGGRIIAATVRKHSVNVENWGLLAGSGPRPEAT